MIGHRNGNVFLCEKDSCQTIQSFVFNAILLCSRIMIMLHYGTFVVSVSKNTLILWDSSTSTAPRKTNFKKEITVCCCGAIQKKIKSPALITCTSSGEIICWYFNENSTEKILKYVEFSSVGEFQNKCCNSITLLKICCCRPYKRYKNNFGMF